MQHSGPVREAAGMAGEAEGRLEGLPDTLQDLLDKHRAAAADSCSLCAPDQEKTVKLEGATKQLQACQDSLRKCQTEAARKSAARAAAEARLQQALAAAEADLRASAQASRLYACLLSNLQSVHLQPISSTRQHNTLLA